MKLFDVMVFNTKTLSDSVYRTALTKRDAKKLVNELKSKGFKSHAVTSRGNSAPQISLDKPEYYSDEE